MIKLRDINAEKPLPYPTVMRELATVRSKAWTSVDGFVLRDGIDLMPQVGMQEDICSSDVNLIFAVSAATGGKTYAGMLRALKGVDRQNYTARLVTMNQKSSKKGGSFHRDFKAISDCFNAEFSGTESPIAYYPETNSAIGAMHLNFNTLNPKEYIDAMEYLKTIQASYMYWDELTSIKDQRIFMYSLSRNRDASGMTPCTFATFNAKKNHFTYEILLSGGYIDLSEDIPKLNKDMVGKVKYWYNKGMLIRDIIWGWSREEVAEKANIVLSADDIEAGLSVTDMVKSFTVLTGEAAANRILVNATQGQSVANLHNVGEKQRRSLKECYFVDDDDEETQNVSSAMMQNLWSNPYDYEEGQMTAGLDVSKNGTNSDGTIMVFAKGKVLVGIEEYAGDIGNLASWVGTMLAKYNVPKENLAFDANGVGSFLTGYTSGYGIVPQARCLTEYDADGNIISPSTANLRAQLLQKLEALITLGEFSVSLPAEYRIKYNSKGDMRTIKEILSEDAAIFKTTKRNNRVYYLLKDEFKARYKRSPDLTDAISYLMVFQLAIKAKKREADPVTTDSWLNAQPTYQNGVFILN